MAAVANPRSRPMTPFQERLGRVAVQWMTGVNNVAYRLSGGRVAGHLPSGAPICLLTTTGRRTRLRRTVPLLCLRDGADLVVVASRGGMSAHPAWYLNLRADPHAVVQLGSAVTRVRARDATEEERHRLWPALTAVYEHFDAYQARSPRRIPVVILSPA
jgi:deazaflavin-dependent oxidoreductase (nitroreductase family)